MKTTRVAIASGATPTPVPATIPAKFAKIVEDTAIPSEQLVVTLLQSDHSFASEVTYAPGTPILIQGYSGIIARPVGYSAFNIPASGEPMCKIRTVSGSAITVRVQEFEVPPEGEV